VSPSTLIIPVSLERRMTPVTPYVILTRYRHTAFASSKLYPTERGWATIKREEAYAVVFALRKFRNFFFAARIIVYSDHNPLT
jgi:hypothetical protein